MRRTPSRTAAKSRRDDRSLHAATDEALLAEVSWRLRQYLAGCLRAHREAAGVSIMKAATAAGISRAHVSNIESGTFGASDEVLAAWAALYGCEVADLHKPVPAEDGKAA